MRPSWMTIELLYTKMTFPSFMVTIEQFEVNCLLNKGGSGMTFEPSNITSGQLVFWLNFVVIHNVEHFYANWTLITQDDSLGSRREAFLSQNIRTCMCSFTFNPAFHQNSKVFSYNLALPLIYCWPTRLGKLLIRLKPPATQSNGNVLWNTLQPIGAQSILVTDFWKIPFDKRYCFMNLVQQNGIAYLFGSPTHCNI